MGCTLALDIGTTHIKALVADEHLQFIAKAAVKNGPDEDGEYGPVYDAEALWRRAAEAVRTAVLQAARPVTAIGLTGMADCGLLVNEAGAPLCPVFLWSNPCGAENRGEILARFPLAGLYHTTGQALHPKFALSRLTWLQKHRPALFAQAAAWLSLYDFILLKLTGSLVTDETMACRTMLYNIRRRAWEEDLCRFAGVQGKLPRVLPPGGLAGGLTATAAAELNLTPGTPVACAGHDHPCALFALHHYGQAVTLNSLGTSEVFVGAMAAPALPDEAAGLGVNQGCFYGGGYYWLANLPSSGASLEWLRKIAATGGPVEYADFDANPAADAGGVTYIPHLNGSGTPQPNPAARGAFLGLSSATTVYQLARAVNEGIAFETRRIYETLQALPGVDVGQPVATGGGARNLPLLQAKASITGRALRPAGIAELTAFGAALAALLATGAAAPAGPPPPGQVQPEPGCPQAYNAPYRRYLALCRAIEI